MSKVVKYADRYNGIEERYWEEMFRMIEENKPVSLGMGMPNFKAWPQSIMDAMVDITVNGGYELHQYTRGGGHPRLVNILAKLYSLLLQQKIDPVKNILVTIGAFQAIHCSIYGLTNPGDEVIIIDPHFDPYTSMVKSADAVPVFVPLYRSENNSKTEWRLDFNELESKFSDKTRLIIVNTPLNPLGKVFTRTELEKISELCIKFNVIVVSDEVYEWITYDNRTHFRIASIPGMFERSITIGSVGKTFSLTGWHCGWAICGDPNITNALFKAHTASVYTVPTNIQEAAARAFELEFEKLVNNNRDDLYWTKLSELVLNKRNSMIKMLTPFGFEPIPSQGGYFMAVDCTKLINKIDLTDFEDKRGKTFAFVNWLSKNGLQVVPLSIFFSKKHKHLGEGLIRICITISDETLAEAERVLTKLRSKLDKQN